MPAHQLADCSAASRFSSDANGVTFQTYLNLTAFKGEHCEVNASSSNEFCQASSPCRAPAMRSELPVASLRIAGSDFPAVQASCRFTTASCCPDVDHTDAVQSMVFPQSIRRQSPCFELASTETSQNKPSPQFLLSKRPIALLSLIPRPAVLFTAGAVSGAIGKTLTAPLDRVKLLLQTSGGLQQGAVKQAVRKGGVWDALVAIGRTEGIRGYWKGNLPQVCTW